MDITRELARAVAEGRVSSREELERLKRQLAAAEGKGSVPTDAEVLAALGDGAPSRALELLRTKPSRSLSGVTVVAVMAPPAPCPHGRCAYCPGGVEQGTPQSYTGKEPAARRADRAGFDGGIQVRDRLAQLAGAGHPVDKVELVVMGGTFPSLDGPARATFMMGCLEALNGAPSGSLPEAIDANDGGAHRCVALTLETRPDLCDPRGVDALLAMGATRVEIGVQVTEDAPLDAVGRGHGVAESVEATRNLKDAGLKVGYHLMLGLPGMTPTDDLRALGRVLDDERFRPDLLKLYPTLVMPGTELHGRWGSGEYEPLDEAGAIGILASFKARLPPWVRVSRVERDIPSNLIAAGVRASNLRQMVAARMASEGTRCRCIRCREVGRRGTDRPEGPGALWGPADPGRLETRVTRYRASGGEEAFISFELPEHDTLVAYARLRWPSASVWREELPAMALLREVRVLGAAVRLGERPPADASGLVWQHRGLGGLLLDRCGEVASDWGMEGVAVTAGMGTRAYFRARGYARAGPYMVKGLD